MANTRARRYHAKIIEGLLPPTQKGIALAIALKLSLHVVTKGAVAAKVVHHHRVVNDQVNWREGIDFFRVTAQVHHRIPHRSEVNYSGHTGKVLHQHSRRSVGNFFIGTLGRQPGRDRLHIVRFDGAIVFVAQQIFEQDFKAKRESSHVT